LRAGSPVVLRQWRPSAAAYIFGVEQRFVGAKDSDDDLSDSVTVVAPETYTTGVRERAAASAKFDTGAQAVRIAGRYEILGLIGRGGMGAVYRVRDIELDETVALKVLQSELGESPELLERFRREVKLARRVTHPNVARTYDIGEHEGTKFLTMEFIDGQSLADLAQSKLSVARVLEIAAAICAGLAAAHKAGVVHRDLKPDNVLVSRDGRVVITDFGIARDPASAVGNATIGIVGTPAYMAPEQVEGSKDIDSRADIYALGVMLFELLTGDLPWKGASPFTLAAARLNAPPPDPRGVRSELSPGLSSVVIRCMARDPATRFTSGDEVARALLAAGPTLPHGAHPPSPMPSVAPAPLREKAVAVLPFRNLGSPDDEYVAEGISDDLIDALSMTTGLRVRPRGIVARFKGVDADPREVGRELGVDVIVEGSVRKSATQIRLTARLTSVEDGFQLWARRFDRPAGDLLVVSDESARAIADALTLHAKGPKRVALSDPVAIDLYLRGRAELRQHWPPHPAQAVELLAQAYERAPDDPTIVACFARACTRLWFFGGADGAELPTRSRELTVRAVRAAPENPDVLLTQALLQLLEGDPVASAGTCRRVLELAPDNVEARELAARLLLEAGEIEVALPMLEQVLRDEPTLGQAQSEIVRGYALLGDFERVLELLSTAAVDSAAYNGGLFRARLATWSPDVAKTIGMVVIPPDAPQFSPWAYARVMKMLCEGEPVEDLLRAFADYADRPDRLRRFFTLAHQMLAEARGYLGQNEGAIEHVERAAAADLFDLGWVDRCPPLAALRDEPRFIAARATVAEKARHVIEALGMSAA
jgi:eukaryotic-like serine/threonine-protein kinase